MADLTVTPGVIPLFRNAPPAPAPSAVPPETVRLVRESGLAIFRFLAPALLLACGMAMVTMAAASLTRAVGWTDADAPLLAVKTAGWVFLAAAGTALATRGLVLAQLRWR